MEKNKLLNIIGFFRIPFQAISHTPDGYEIVHIYNQEASKIFYSGEFIPISEHSMFIMQKMDGNRIISEAIPIRVVSVQEYTVDDKGFIIRDDERISQYQNENNHKKLWEENEDEEQD